MQWHAAWNSTSANLFSFHFHFATSAARFSRFSVSQPVHRVESLKPSHVCYMRSLVACTHLLLFLSLFRHICIPLKHHWTCLIDSSCARLCLFSLYLSFFYSYVVNVCIMYTQVHTRQCSGKWQMVCNNVLHSLTHSLLILISCAKCLIFRDLSPLNVHEFPNQIYMHAPS